MTCPQCSRPAEAGQRFCGQCGSALALSCPRCQHPLAPEHRFCGSCGLAVKSDTGPESTEPEQQKAAPTQPLSALQTSGDRRIVTVLFTDVSGFTAMSERLDPEAVTEIINTFFRVLVEPIDRYGGVVDKYIGDAIMALFGAPVAHEDDPERAVRAAWEMQLKAAQHAETLEKSTGIRLKVRIGLNTGLVVAGKVGSSQRADYTVMGDTVNLAQRMEANARAGRVLVTAETYHQTKHAFRFEALAPITVKGKAEPVEVYEVAGPLPRTGPLAKDDDVFVGREGELEALAPLWRATLGGKPHLVVLSGEAGTGKSALARRFLRKTRQDGAVVRFARCLSYEQTTAYALVAELLRSWIGATEHDPAATVLQKLEGLVTEALPDDEKALALLGRLLGLEVDHPEVASLSPRQARTGAFIALDDLVVWQARQGPLVLALEDLHWVDDASLEWLTVLLQRLSTESGTLPLLLLCQARTEPTALSSAAERLAGVRLTLGPLSGADVESLATMHLGATRQNLPSQVQAVVQKALDRAEGNPFYLAEMLRSLTDGGILVRSGATWAIGRSDAGGLPSTVHGAVAARLDRLSPAAREIVEIAAVIGKRCDQQLLEAVAASQREDAATKLPQALAELVDRKVLYARQTGEIGFNQTILHEVAYKTLLLARRRDLHGKVADSLEQQAGSDLGASAATLAKHFVAAEDAPKAAHYLYLAGERARASYANAEAIGFYKAALEWQDTADRLAGKETPASPMRENQNDLDRASVHSGIPRAEIWLQMALLETLSGEFEAALSKLDAHDALAGRTTQSVRARGDVLERQGDFGAARASYQQAFDLADGDPLEQARARGCEGNVLRRIGEFGAALALCQEAHRDLEAAHQPAEAAFVHGVMGICYQRFNDFEGARRAHLEALRLREQAGDLEGMAKSHNNLGILDGAVGRWAEAYQHYSKGLMIFRKLGDRSHLAMTLINLGDLLLKQGDDEMAERHFRESYKLASQLGDLVNALTAEGSLVEVYLARGQGQEALDQVDSCLQRMAESGHNEWVPELHLYRARALTLLDALEEAEPLLDLALAEAQAIGRAFFAGLVDRARAEIAVRRGQEGLAAELALRSLDTLRDSGLLLDLGRTLALLARVAPRADREGYQLEATALFARLGARKDLEALVGSRSSTAGQTH